MGSKSGNRGFTLVEILLVMVIVGLLFGGVLKSQELVNGAKVRSIANSQASVNIAWHTFTDRFSRPPGHSPMSPRAGHMARAAGTRDMDAVEKGMYARSVDCHHTLNPTAWITSFRFIVTEISAEEISNLEDACALKIENELNIVPISWTKFFDRYSALPGDYNRASGFIAGARSGNGDKILSMQESVMAFQQLAATGLIECEKCAKGDGSTKPTAENSPLNPYGGIMSIWHDTGHYAHLISRKNLYAPNQQLQLHTGSKIPSNIIAIVDKKIDDGTPHTGLFRFNDFHPDDPDGSAGLKPRVRFCMSEFDGAGYHEMSTDRLAQNYKARWRSTTLVPVIIMNCGASTPI